MALNRVAFGVRFLLTPDAAGPTWVGRRNARRRAVQLLVRALGARDIGLGLGALAALRSADASAARSWMLAHALSDATDLAVTVAARDKLPDRPSGIAAGVAGASTAVAAASAALLSATRQTDA